MKEIPHTINGKFVGVFYDLDDGRKLFLAHRTPGMLHRKRMAWVMSEMTLVLCQDLSYEAVGVVMRKSGKTHFFLTHIKDYFDPEKSFGAFDGMPQRGLPIKWFRVQPGNTFSALDRITTVTR